MKLTMEQRIAALERESIVLSDTVKLLHKLLKEQRRLINDYITQKVMSTRQSGGQEGGVHPENEVYAFVCRTRFERLERQIEKMRKLIESQDVGLKAG